MCFFFSVRDSNWKPTCPSESIIRQNVKYPFHVKSLRNTNKSHQHVQLSMVSNEFGWVTLAKIEGLYFIGIHILSQNYKVGNRLEVVTWKSLLKMEQYLETDHGFLSLRTQTHTWKHTNDCRMIKQSKVYALY